MAEIRVRIDDYCTGIGIPLDRNYGTFPAEQMMELGAKATKWWNKTYGRQKMTRVLMDALIHRMCLDKVRSKRTREMRMQTMKPRQQLAGLPSEYESAAEESGDEVEDIAARQGRTTSSPVDVQERPSSQSPPPEALTPPPPQSADTDVEDSTNTGMAPAGREVAAGVSGRLPVTTSLLQEYLQWYIALVDNPRRVDSIIRAGNILMQEDFELITIQKFRGFEWQLLGITLGIGLALQQDIGAFLDSRRKGQRRDSVV
ncbi:hypothetical protein FN846DRAFT_907247 [Sphaerosporella brunnea]|uniref:Uncharacterized protein n=1 Tax=Sphaerosporella brunnea TaxID=1250544 RepID=A0A5J5EW53_9PEZI|nr:hypothetical protein FN846DRAFT_907247 [Sphaerosporella brunnea]